MTLPAPPARALPLLAFASVAFSVALGPLAARPASAQQFPATVTVTGTIVADGMGAPIPNAIVSVPARWVSRLTADDGRFVLPGVPVGTHILRVQHFGYEDLEVVVEIREDMAPLDLSLLPDPVELRELSVQVDGAITLTGRVLHSRTRAPMPNVYVWVPSAERGVLSDSAGEFRLPTIATGPHLLQVEHTGFGRQYIPIVATPPWRPIVIQMAPDPLVLAGLPAAERTLRIRRNRYLGVVKNFDAGRLLSLEVDNTWKVVQAFTHVQVVPCRGAGLSELTRLPLGAWCVRAGGQIIAPVVCIDGELDLGGLDSLQKSRPHELAGLEVYGMVGTTIRAYTHGYMESLARSDRSNLATRAPEAGSPTGLGWVTRRTRTETVQLPDLQGNYGGAPC